MEDRIESETSNMELKNAALRNWIIAHLMKKREISVSASGLSHMVLVEDRNLTADDLASLAHEPRYMVMDQLRSLMKQGIIERENHGKEPLYCLARVMRLSHR
jgi:predicted transcriptional regulator